MAIIEKRDQDGGAAPPEPGGGAEAREAPQPIRHNLPLKAAPVIGRRPEMQRIVQIFDRARRDGRPSRVEVVGPPGVGATTVAVELARRAGHRFPGGAWYVHLGMGADVAWATLGAMREGRPVRDLAKTAQDARDRLASQPKALVIVDGATSADEATAAIPSGGDAAPDVFVVAEGPLRTVDAEQVCEVSPVPRHGARRIAYSMLRHSQPDAKPPAVRTLDGLAITAALAARAALAYAGKVGPISIDDTKQAMTRLIQLVARNPAALEMVLLAAVAHPVRLSSDALFLGLKHVRKGRGADPTEEEVGTALMWLAHAGIFEPLDEQHFSMHPILQRIVQTMTQTPEDLEVARDALAAGVVAEADASIGAEGVDLPRASLHQVRHLAATAGGETQAKVRAVLGRLDAALGVNGAPST